MRYLALHTVLLAPVLLAACASPVSTPRSAEAGPVAQNELNTADNTVTGTAPGSIAGGSSERPRATTSNTLLGGVLGGVIGRSMDGADRTAYDKAAERALETGEKQAWANPESGHHGTIVPLKSYTNSSSRHCRQYTQTVYIDGRPHAGFGTACRSSGGAWQVASK